MPMKSGLQISSYTTEFSIIHERKQYKQSQGDFLILDPAISFFIDVVYLLILEDYLSSLR